MGDHRPSGLPEAGIGKTADMRTGTRDFAPRPGSLIPTFPLAHSTRAQVNSPRETGTEYRVVKLWSRYLFRVPEPPRVESAVEFLGEDGWEPCAAVWQSVRSLGPQTVATDLIDASTLNGAGRNDPPVRTIGRSSG